MFSPAFFPPDPYHVAARPVTVRRQGKRLTFRVCVDTAKECGISAGWHAHVLVEKAISGALTGKFRLSASKTPSGRTWIVSQSTSRHPIFTCQYSGDLAQIFADLGKDTQLLTIHEKHPKNGITLSYDPTPQ